MANIFISYNRKTEAAARVLAEDFESLGHSVWLDQKLSGGQAWWDEILSMVRRCDVFVFVLDPGALNSTACKREYGYAAELGKPILPVLVSDGVNVNLLPPALSQIQFVDYRKQDDRGAAFRLARALGTVPPPNPLPDPLPAPPDAPISHLGTLTARVEGASGLSYEQQSALVVDLKRSLRDPESAADTRALLERLRKRHDLLAIVAEEIDEVLRSTRKVETPVKSSRMLPPLPEPPGSMKTSPTGVEGGQPKKTEPQDSDVQTTWTSLGYKTTWVDRLKGAGLVTVTGTGVGYLGGYAFSNIGTGVEDVASGEYSFYYYPSLFAAVAGAIAGAISGTKPLRIVPAVIGTILAVMFSAKIVYDMYGTLGWVFPLLLPPLSALAGVAAEVYVTRRKA